MREVELSAGTIEYEDTGGKGPVLVLLHGLAQNGSLWRNVVSDLREDHRCVVPTLPLGGHRHPMLANADLTMHGISRLMAEFIERLDLRGAKLRCPGTRISTPLIYLLADPSPPASPVQR